ncbi:MAG TPA: 50S ribosomal protein L29 [Actinomycetota bacterium]|nr:50S ribosomal protein L29 [Actinomycetota bacterium]
MSKEADKLRDLAEDEFDTKLAEAKEELFNLRFQLVTGQLDNPMQIKVVRKQVARLLTLMRERELEELEAQAATGAEEA